MPDPQPIDPVRTIPWGVLASTPRNLPPHWLQVFEVFKAPVLIASGLFFNADLMERTEEELRAKYRFLHPTFSALSAVLDNLDVIAPQTWKAGCAIRQSLWHAWATLNDFKTRDMLGELITPDYLDAIRKRLVELKPNFDAAALLFALREAVAAEYTIALPDPSSQPALNQVPTNGESDAKPTSQRKGPKVKFRPQDDRQLIVRWQAAKALGKTQIEFESENELKPGAVERAQTRERDRQSKAQ
jgi:hypothetical protein